MHRSARVCRAVRARSRRAPRRGGLLRVRWHCWWCWPRCLRPRWLSRRLRGSRRRRAVASSSCWRSCRSDRASARCWCASARTAAARCGQRLSAHAARARTGASERRAAASVPLPQHAGDGRCGPVVQGAAADESRANERARSATPGRCSRCCVALIVPAAASAAGARHAGHSGLCGAEQRRRPDLHADHPAAGADDGDHAAAGGAADDDRVHAHHHRAVDSAPGASAPGSRHRIRC